VSHPLAQHAWIARRQTELTAQYICEGTFKLTPAEEKLLARAKLNARKKAKLDFLQRKHDECVPALNMAAAKERQPGDADPSAMSSAVSFCPLQARQVALWTREPTCTPASACLGRGPLEE